MDWNKKRTEWISNGVMPGSINASRHQWMRITAAGVTMWANVDQPNGKMGVGTTSPSADKDLNKQAQSSLSFILSKQNKAPRIAIDEKTETWCFRTLSPEQSHARRSMWRGLVFGEDDSSNSHHHLTASISTKNSHQSGLSELPAMP